MVRNLSVHIVVAVSIVSPAMLLANPIVNDTAQVIKKIKKSVIKQAQEDQQIIRRLSGFIDFASFFKIYDKIEIANAKVAFPFFKVKGADACLKTIGSTQEDLDYLKSVFTEFYASGERTKYRLYTILHRHMMVALNFPVTKTLDQFKHMMENTNHHGIPKDLTKKQFEIYCRCVARGLYAVHWLKHGYN